MRPAALTTLVLCTVLHATAKIVDPVQAAAIIAQLEDAQIYTAHFDLLDGRDVRSRQPLVMHGTTLTHDPPQFVSDLDTGVGKGAGRKIVAANLADIPFLVGQRTSLAADKTAYVALSLSSSYQSKQFSARSGHSDYPPLTTTRKLLNSSTWYLD